MKKRPASVKAADPLSSWAEGPAKSAIVQFVQSAEANGWIIVDMKNDWKRVFAFEGVE